MKKPYKKKGAGNKKAAESPKNKSLSSEKSEIRLNRYIANSGICSRREADKLIEAGKIKVNGKLTKELGTKVSNTDKVEYEGKVIKPEKFIYVLLNKPKGFITTRKDPRGRRTVMELIKNAAEERIYPIGRLDRATTGVLLFTNDGDFAQKLAHPSMAIPKIYEVILNKALTKNDFDSIAKGTELEDGLAEVDDLAYVSEDKKNIGVKIHSGRNRIVRRIFEHYGYTIEKLDRVMFAGLDKKGVSRGQWRYLSDKEIIRLKYFQ